MTTATNPIIKPNYLVFKRFLNLLLFDQFELPALDNGNYPLNDFPRMYDLIICGEEMLSPNAGIQHFTNTVTTFFMDSNEEDRTNLFTCYKNSHAKSVILKVNDAQKSAYLGLSKHESANFTDEDLEFATVVRSEDTPQILSFLFNHFADFYSEVKINGKNISEENYRHLLKLYTGNLEVAKVIENAESPLFSEPPKSLTAFTDDEIKNYQLACFIPLKQRKKD